MIPWFTSIFSDEARHNYYEQKIKTIERKLKLIRTKINEAKAEDLPQLMGKIIKRNQELTELEKKIEKLNPSKQRGPLETSLLESQNTGNLSNRLKSQSKKVAEAASACLSKNIEFIQESPESYKRAYQGKWSYLLSRSYHYFHTRIEELKKILQNAPKQSMVTVGDEVRGRHFRIKTPATVKAKIDEKSGEAYQSFTAEVEKILTEGPSEANNAAIEKALHTFLALRDFAKKLDLSSPNESTEKELTRLVSYARELYEISAKVLEEVPGETTKARAKKNQTFTNRLLNLKSTIVALSDPMRWNQTPTGEQPLDIKTLLTNKISDLKNIINNETVAQLDARPSELTKSKETIIHKEIGNRRKTIISRALNFIISRERPKERELQKLSFQLALPLENNEPPLRDLFDESPLEDKRNSPEWAHWKAWLRGKNGDTSETILWLSEDPSKALNDLVIKKGKGPSPSKDEELKQEFFKYLHQNMTVFGYLEAHHDQKQNQELIQEIERKFNIAKESIPGLLDNFRKAKDLSTQKLQNIQTYVENRLRFNSNDPKDLEDWEIEQILSPFDLSRDELHAILKGNILRIELETALANIPERNLETTASTQQKIQNPEKTRINTLGRNLIEIQRGIEPIKPQDLTSENLDKLTQALENIQKAYVLHNEIQKTHPSFTSLTKTLDQIAFDVRVKAGRFDLYQRNGNDLSDRNNKTKLASFRRSLDQLKTRPIGDSLEISQIEQLYKENIEGLLSKQKECLSFLDRIEKGENIPTEERNRLMKTYQVAYGQYASELPLMAKYLPQLKDETLILMTEAMNTRFLDPTTISNRFNLAEEERIVLEYKKSKKVISQLVFSDKEATFEEKSRAFENYRNQLTGYLRLTPSQDSYQITQWIPSETELREEPALVTFKTSSGSLRQIQEEIPLELERITTELDRISTAYPDLVNQMKTNVAIGVRQRVIELLIRKEKEGPGFLTEKLRLSQQTKSQAEAALKTRRDSLAQEKRTLFKAYLSNISGVDDLYNEIASREKPNDSTLNKWALREYDKILAQKKLEGILLTPSREEFSSNLQNLSMNEIFLNLSTLAGIDPNTHVPILIPRFKAFLRREIMKQDREQDRGTIEEIRTKVDDLLFGKAWTAWVRPAYQTAPNHKIIDKIERTRWKENGITQLESMKSQLTWKDPGTNIETLFWIHFKKELNSLFKNPPLPKFMIDKIVKKFEDNLNSHGKTLTLYPILEEILIDDSRDFIEKRNGVEELIDSKPEQKLQQSVRGYFQALGILDFTQEQAKELLLSLKEYQKLETRATLDVLETEVTRLLTELVDPENYMNVTCAQNLEFSEPEIESLKTTFFEKERREPETLLTNFNKTQYRSVFDAAQGICQERLRALDSALWGEA